MKKVLASLMALALCGPAHAQQKVTIGYIGTSMDDVAAAVMPVAMPPLREMLQGVVAQRVPIFV